jgi:hypothetical protein
MKYIISILVVYIVILNVLPCVDGLEKGIGKETFIPSVPHHGGENDSCSPFCVCSCCSVIVNISTFFYDARPILTSQNPVFPFFTDSYSSFFRNFWLPPKLA